MNLLGVVMALKPGDSVRTESGEVGNVVHIDRLTVFVTFVVPGKSDRMEAFLESQLTKIEPSSTADEGDMRCNPDA